jgi:hypothetical protein
MLTALYRYAMRMIACRLQFLCGHAGMCTSYCGWHTYGYDSKNRQTL